MLGFGFAEFHLDLSKVWPTHVEFATDVAVWLNDACSVELRIWILGFNLKVVPGGVCVMTARLRRPSMHLACGVINRAKSTLCDAAALCWRWCADSEKIRGVCKGGWGWALEGAYVSRVLRAVEAARACEMWHQPCAIAVCMGACADVFMPESACARVLCERAESLVCQICK